MKDYSKETREEWLERMYGNACVLLKAMTEKYQNGQYDMGTSWVISGYENVISKEFTWEYDGS